MNYFDFHFVGEHYSFILFLAILTLALSILLKSAKLFIAQIAMLLSFSLLHAGTAVGMAVVLITVQILINGFILYRFKKAVDRNYQLILEKTHQIPRKLTKANNGSERSFL